MSQDKVFKIFVDFDGTITQKDIGEEMFLKFGDAEEANRIIERWIKNEITSVDTWQQLCATVKNFDEDEFETFLNGIDIDPTFKSFVDYCDDNNFEIMILSDGLDYYINKFLKREGLDHITAYTNRLIIEGNNLVPQFPYTDEECKQCANCKRNHIINNSSDDDYTVYIGDGYSDACPVQYCDFIFAKKSLLKYCETNRISYSPFKDFNDIQRKLEELKNRKRLKHRHQAELKRREVYLQG